MKKSLIIVLLASLTLSLHAEKKAAPENTLALRVLVEEPIEPAPPASKEFIENKLNALLTQNGVTSMDYLGQFFITARTLPLTKDIMPGPPTKISETMEINFYIADAYNQVVFSTASATLKGLGETESKCYMNALKQIKLNTPKMKQFVEEGKKKIIDYYNTQAEKMMKQALALSKMKEYEKALWIISTIPSECDKYNDAIKVGLDIYQEYVDHLCNVSLAQARAAWMAEQNSTGAEAAGEFLGKILPDAKCYGEAMELYKEIKGKVLDDWKFEMKMYQDGVDLEFARIEAMRDVGVAFGKGQQPISTNLMHFIR